MTRPRALVVATTIILPILFSLAALARDRMFWPFSHYPMYSGLYSSRTAITRAVGVDARGHESAGIAKIRHSGLDWITSDSMRWLLSEQQYTHLPLLDWAAVIAAYPVLRRALTASTVALEVSYPLALFVVPLRPWIVLGTIALQLGIHLFMGINYVAFLLANVVWVDWEALGRKLLVRLNESGVRLRTYSAAN